ncbi:hypothetical protein MACJ_000759 [Theileria orientalis]|uniref:MMS19 nucleotide excision repair protein n=1 Tax=Theileria orientalis TaxID=68886 RepID=A0A976QRY6_THEOR|nr:hypothetical protein MACJ_000759 [Theileria orientalis]
MSNGNNSLEEVTKSYLSTHDVYKLNEYRNSILISVNISKGARFLSILDGICEEEEDPVVKKDLVKLLYEVTSRTENAFKGLEVIEFLSKCTNFTICLHLCVNVTKALLERHFDNAEDKDYRALERYFRTLSEKKISQYPQQCRIDFLKISHHMVDLVVRGKVAEFDIELLCESISEEKDPRNLLTMFELLSKLAKSVARKDKEFESIAKTYLVYFPIQFVPPKKDKICIRPLELKKGLLGCFKSNKKLARYSMELLLDTLYSEFTVDENHSVLKDTLYFLKNCKPVYGANFGKFAKYFIQVVKMELLATPTTETSLEKLKLRMDEPRSPEGKGELMWTISEQTGEGSVNIYSAKDEPVTGVANIIRVYSGTVNREGEESRETTPVVSSRELSEIEGGDENTVEEGTRVSGSIDEKAHEGEDLGELDVDQINKIGTAYYKGSSDLDEKVWVFGEIMRLFLDSLDEVEEEEVVELFDGIRKTIHLNYSLAYMVEVLSENSRCHNKIIERIVLPLIKDVYSLFDNSLRNDLQVGDELQDDDDLQVSEDLQDEDYSQHDDDSHRDDNSQHDNESRHGEKSSDDEKTGDEEWNGIDFNRKGEMCNIHTIVSKCIMPKILINFKKDLISEELLVFLLRIDRNKNGFFKYNKEGASNYLKLLLLSSSIVKENVIYEVIERVIGNVFVKDSIVASTITGAVDSSPKETIRSIDSSSSNKAPDKPTSARIVVKWEQKDSYWAEVALNLKILTSIYKSHKGVCYPIVKVLNSMVPVHVRVSASNYILTRMRKMSTKSNLLISSQMAELLGITLSKWTRPKENYDMDRLVRNIIQIVFSGLEEMIKIMNRKYVTVHSSMDHYRSSSIGSQYQECLRDDSSYDSSGASGEVSRCSSESSLDMSVTGLSISNATSGLKSDVSSGNISGMVETSDGNILMLDCKGVDSNTKDAEGMPHSSSNVTLIRADSTINRSDTVSMGGLHSMSPLDSFREYADQRDKENRFGFIGYVFRGLKEKVGTIDISDSEDKEETNYNNAMRIIYANLLIEVLESPCKTLFMEMFEKRRLVEFFSKTFNYYKNALGLAEDSGYVEVFKAKKVPVILSILGSSLELDMRKYMDHRTMFINIYFNKPELCENKAKHTQSCLENVYYNYGSVELSLLNLETMVVYNEYLNNIDEVLECTYSNGSVLVKCVQNMYKYDFKEITEQIRLLDNYKLTMREYDELFFLFLPISLNYNKGAYRTQLIDIRERYRKLYEKSKEERRVEGEDEKTFEERTERLLGALFEKMTKESHEAMPNYTHRLAENYFSKLEINLSFLLILLHRGARNISEDHLREVVESMSEMVRNILKYQDERQRKHEKDGVSEYVHWCCDRYLMYIQALLFGVVSELNNSGREEELEPLRKVLTFKLEGIVEDLLKISKSSKVPFARMLAILTTHVIMSSKHLRMSRESRRKVIKHSSKFLGDSSKKVRAIAVLCRQEWLNKQDE